jgi:hypothetical protein
VWYQWLKEVGDDFPNDSWLYQPPGYIYNLNPGRMVARRFRVSLAVMKLERA